MMIDSIRDTNGKLPSYAWPGGYPLFYLDKSNSVICPECANREIDDAQKPIAYDTNWEDNDLYCEDCNKRIESAYAED